MRAKGAIYLFESVRKHRYTVRGVRKMLAHYAAQAGITRSMSPHETSPRPAGSSALSMKILVGCF